MYRIMDAGKKLVDTSSSLEEVWRQTINIKAQEAKQYEEVSW